MKTYISSQFDVGA